MDYNIGLDDGTNSVGFAAIDDNKHLVRAKGSNIIGARLFGAAAKAEERRSFRTTRRRLKRRKWRLGLLNEIFAPHLAEIDENFLARLRQSNLVGSDPLKMDTKSYLFGDQDDHGFRKDNPTIYHLRQKLMTEDRKFDLREVYLAIHHLVKYRGHFLYATPMSQFKTGDLNLQENFRRLNELFRQMMPETPFELDVRSLKKVESILLDESLSKSDRQKTLLAKVYMHSSEDNKKQKKANKDIATNILKAILGLKVKFDTIFQLDTDKETAKDWTFSLADGDVEDKQNQLFELMDGNQIEVFNILSMLHTGCLLTSILSDDHGGRFETISESMVYRYEQHRDHLKLLKIFEKQVDEKTAAKLKKAYDDYIDGDKGKKISQEDFAKTVEKQLDDSKIAQQIKTEIRLGKFMPKQRTRENAVIPRQLQQQELDRIIEMQSKYYPWLAELSPNESRRHDAKYMLDELIAFRIPYYIGPMVTPEAQKKGSNASFAWMVRKESGRITPWNFEQKVDKKKSANQFIRRMTSTDTFLLGEPVLPANSLLYQRFTVLNELNMIKINGEKITRDQKQAVFEKLFKNHTNVSVKLLQTFLRSEGEYKASEAIEITGLSNETKFNSKLTSYIDYRKIFGDRVDRPDLQKDFESMIEWSTVFEEGSMYQEKLAEIDWLTEDEQKKLGRLHYKGWGKLSHKLLAELVNDQGERIIDELWNTTHNFQQIRRQDDFKKQIQLANQGSLDETDIESQLEDLRTSPENKRAIRQMISIVDDIKNAMHGQAPKRIFVEFSRDDENMNHTRTVSRADQVKNAYQKAAQEISDLPEFNEHDADKNGKMADKFFLYYMQAGKDPYTGNDINMDDPNKYDIDHILPRSFTWDDSLDNRVLTEKDANNQKGDHLPQTIFGQTQSNLWLQLKRAHLISERKYRNLTLDETHLSKYGASGFINRQLVDTRQIIKYAVEILAHRYPDTEIVTIKADLNHQFREHYHLYKNRNVNDYHHGFDAYLSGFIGEYLLETYPKLKGYLVYGDYSKKISDDFHAKNLLYHFFHQFDYRVKLKDGNEPVDLIPSKQKDIFDYLVHVYFFKKMLVTKAVHVHSGAMYKQTLFKAIDDSSYGKKGQNKTLIPAKRNRPTALYGGYTQRVEAFATLIKEHGKSEDVYRLKGIPMLYLSEIRRTEKSYLKDKLKQILIKLDPKKLNEENFEVLIPIVSKNQLVIDNGKKMTIGGSENVQNAQQLVLSWSSIDELRKPANKLQDEDDERMLAIYDEVSNQVENYFPLYERDPFKKIFSKNRNLFEDMPTKTKFKDGKPAEVGKKQVIDNILKGLHANADRVNLSEIGNKADFGRFQYRGGIKLSPNAQIIYQSPTGLFERRVAIKDIKA